MSTQAVTPQSQPEFLTKRQAAQLCGFNSLRTLDKLARRAKQSGIAPPPKIKLSRKLVLYNRAALIEWLVSFQTGGAARPPKRGPGRPRGSRNRKVA